MTRKQDKPVTAEELLKELHSDPEWVARQEAQEAKRRAWSAVLITSSQPVLAELHLAGFEVETISDLFNRKEPWRKDVPIPPYTQAIPILLRHLGQSYHFTTNEEIVRALTCPDGRVAIDRLVEEYRRTTRPQVVAADKSRGVELVAAGVGNLYTRDEIERLTEANWDSYRFALANAIVYHFQPEHIPLVAELIRSTTDNRDTWGALSEAIRKKMRRWKRNDPDLLTLV